jgi:hypothetical protein
MLRKKKNLFAIGAVKLLLTIKNSFTESMLTIVCVKFNFAKIKLVKLTVLDISNRIIFFLCFYFLSVSANCQSMFVSRLKGSGRKN